MAKTNVFTLLRTARPVEDFMLDSLDQLSTSQLAEENQKIVRDLRTEGEYISATVKWYQREQRATKSDPDFGFLSAGAPKTYSVTVWLRLRSPLVVVFSNAKSVVQEVSEFLRQTLGTDIQGCQLPHGMLAALARGPNVTNVYEVEFRDPDRISGVNSITINGQALANSDVFTQFANRGSRLSRVMAEISSPGGSSFLATVHASGLVVLSPYVTMGQVRTFVQDLLTLAESGGSHGV